MGLLTVASRKEKKIPRTPLKAQNDTSPRAAPFLYLANHCHGFLNPCLDPLPLSSLLTLSVSAALRLDGKS